MESTTLNSIKTTSTLEEIISANKQTKSLLQSIGISTEIHQDKSLLQICVEKQWNEKELLKWLRKKTEGRKEQNSSEEVYFSKLNRKQLFEQYNQIQKKLIPQLSSLQTDFGRICKVHGIQYPVLKEMHWHIDKIIEKVRFISMMADKTIKPLLKSSNNGSDSILYGEAKKYKKSVKLVVQDQHQVASHIQQIDKLDPKPDTMEGICGTLKTVFKEMKELFFEIETFFELLRNGVIPTINQAFNID
jgi:iron-sulfur cluster repair protein YtfE (RIC family)